MTVPERYVRNCTALSPEECRKLATKRVLVVGLGGLGGYVVEFLARTGVGHLRVVDKDTFSEHNLNRQLLCTEENLGCSKVEAAAERVALINSTISLEAHAAYFDESNAADLLHACDCAVGALDSVHTRRVLHEACRQMGIPLVQASIAGWYGQISVVLPGDEDPLSFALQAQDTGIENELGTLCPTAALVASLQASETIKLLLEHPDLLRKKLLMVDLRQVSFDCIDLS